VPETLRRGTVAPPIAYLMATLRHQPDSNRGTDHVVPPVEADSRRRFRLASLPHCPHRWSLPAPMAAMTTAEGPIQQSRRSILG